MSSILDTINNYLKQYYFPMTVVFVVIMFVAKVVVVNKLRERRRLTDLIIVVSSYDIVDVAIIATFYFMKRVLCYTYSRDSQHVYLTWRQLRADYEVELIFI